jgi:hypothetical protein
MINNVDKYLEIANKIKKENGLNDDYCAMISMLKKTDDELYVVVPFVKSDEKVWSKENEIIPEYWALINPIKMELIEFNKTSEKSFNDKEIIKNHSDDSFNKEVSKYIVQTKLKYKEYIKNDIKNNGLLTYQNDVSKLVSNINDEKVSFNDYFYASFEDDINEQIDKLVDLVASVKYNLLTNYYDVLFTDIVNEYISNKKIDNEKLNLACDMMNTYYPGVNGIDNIFNV